MKAGDTFLLKKDAPDQHLRVIVSDPEAFPDQVVFASMTSFDVTKEGVCLIRPGEHPWVRNLTCIAYERMILCTTVELTRLAAASKIVWNVPVSRALLDRIREGASLSRDIKPRLLTVLLEQGVLD